MTDRKAEKGWSPIMPGNPRQKILEEWINEYFNVKLDLSKFKRRDNTRGNGIELISHDSLEGFVFITDYIDKNYKSRTESVRRIYENSGKKILRSFTDYENGLAGFDWRSC